MWCSASRGRNTDRACSGTPASACGVSNGHQRGGRRRWPSAGVAKMGTSVCGVCGSAERVFHTFVMVRGTRKQSGKRQVLAAVPQVPPRVRALRHWRHWRQPWFASQSYDNHRCVGRAGNDAPSGGCGCLRLWGAAISRRSSVKMVSMVYCRCQLPSTGKSDGSTWSRVRRQTKLIGLQCVSGRTRPSAATHDKLIREVKYTVGGCVPWFVCGWCTACRHTLSGYLSSHSSVRL